MLPLKVAGPRLGFVPGSGRRGAADPGSAGEGGPMTAKEYCAMMCQRYGVGLYRHNFVEVPV